MDKLQVNNPVGGLDKENDLQYVKGQDYVDGLNVRTYTKGGSTTGAPEIILGNSHRYTVPDLAVQNKQIRIAGNTITGGTATFDMRTSVEGATYSTASITIPIGNIQTALTNIVAALNTLALAEGYNGVTEVSRDIDNANSGSVVVEMPTYTSSAGLIQGIDWILEVTSGDFLIFSEVKEAISLSITGEKICVGSFNLLDESFTWWTTQRNLPDRRKITFATGGPGPIVVAESEDPGLVDGDEVVITGLPTGGNGKWIVYNVTGNNYSLLGSSTGAFSNELAVVGFSPQASTSWAEIFVASTATLANGDEVYITGTGEASIDDQFWFIQVTSSVSFTLIDSVLVNSGAAGTVSLVSYSIHDHEGFGEIGRAAKSEVDNTWSYIRLIGSKRLNFVTEKQLDTLVERTAALRTEFYFTDDYNVPRYLEYRGEFVQDGFIAETVFPLTSENSYEYSTLNRDSNLFQIPPDVDIDVSQADAGGALISGNYRYILRFSIDGTTYGFATDPSGLINVFAASISNTVSLCGDPPGTQTGKINIIDVSGISGVYNYVQLVAAHYTEGSVNIYSVRTQSLDGSGGVRLYHYGNETTVETIDPGVLFIDQPGIVAALNLRALDQRLVLSNVTYAADPDLTAWAQGITHEVTRDTLDTLGSENPTVGSAERPKYGEYQDYENVFSRVGFMIRETYRFGIQLRSRGTESWTPPYWIDDVEFTTGTSGRRTAGLTDYSLTTLPVPDNPPTDAANCSPYVIYPKFSNLDFEYVTDNGQTVRERFDKIRIVRAECNPTVLATGLAMMMQTDIAFPNGVELSYDCYFEGVAGYHLTPANTYPNTSTTPQRRFMYFLSPDVLLGGVQLALGADDVIYNYGNPTYQIVRQSTSYTVFGPNDAVCAQMYGDATTNVQTDDVFATAYYAGTDTFTFAGLPTTPHYGLYNPFGATQFRPLVLYAGYYLRSALDLTDQNGVGDYGAYYIQYVRPVTNQYGDTSATVYRALGTEFDIETDSSTSSVYSVFGGDTFTQKNYFCPGYANQNPEVAVPTEVSGQIMGFYSQNKKNTQMRKFGAPGSGQLVHPLGNADSTWDLRIISTTNIGTQELRQYDTGYNDLYLLQEERAFDPDAVQPTDFGSRMVYSDIKAANGLINQYRTFLPLNFKDLPTSYGDIFAMEVINGELYTLQEKAFMRQFFNTRAVLDVGDDSQPIVIGSGGVFSVDGRVLSTRGTKHKWSAIKGRAKGGADVWYWIDTNTRTVMRFGADGTRTLSQDKMKAFWANHLMWADNVYTPADGEGICGVWYERYSEVLWTVRAKYQYTEEDVYDNGTTYSDGDVVWYEPPLYYRNFEQTGEFYENTSGGDVQGELPTNTLYWTKIPHTDTRYYNEFTAVYNEQDNEWKPFVSFKPTIYITYQDGFLTPRPLSHTGRMYEHDYGYYTHWYRDTNVEVLGDVAKPAGSLVITGTGTSFLSNFQAGFGILIGSQFMIVRSVESDTLLTVDEYYIEDSGNGDVNGDAASIVAPIGTSYAPYPAQTEDGYLEPIVNIDPQDSKVYIAQQYDTETTPYYTEYHTEDHESFLTESEFRAREDYFWSPVKRDSTSNGINSGRTSEMRGKWMKTKLVFRYLVYQKLYSVLTKVRFIHRRFNS